MKTLRLDEQPSFLHEWGQRESKWKGVMKVLVTDLLMSTAQFIIFSFLRAFRKVPISYYTDRLKQSATSGHILASYGGGPNIRHRYAPGFCSIEISTAISSKRVLYPGTMISLQLFGSEESTIKVNQFILFSLNSIPSETQQAG